MDTGRFLDGPRSSPSCTTAATRRTVRPSGLSSPRTSRHAQCELAASRAPGSRRRIPTTPKTPPRGPVSSWITAASVPTGCPSARQDQRSQIQTFNIAPTWTQLIGPNTVFTFGGFVRQDQYQLLSERQSRSPTSRRICRRSDRRSESQADQRRRPHVLTSPTSRAFTT